MDRREGAGLALGAAALAAGAAAAVADVPALGLAAGVLGLGGAAVASVGARRAVVAADRRHADAEARAASLAEALAEVPEPEETRAASDEVTLLALEEDALADPETGLFGEPYFEVTVHARVAAARRHLRPVAVVLIDVSTGVRHGEPVPLAPAAVAEALRSTLREADTTCRLDDGTFGLVLEDTPENGAVWTVERLRRTIASEHAGVTLRAGVACYPAHAFGSTELRDRAGAALAAAHEWRQDRIEVATASEV